MSHLDFADVGVYDGGKTDQGEKLQAWIDRAANIENGSVQLSGIVRSSRPLDNLKNVPLYGIGSGDNWKVSPSSILFDRDTDGPMIRHSKSWRQVVVKDITLAGPGWGQPQPWGTPLCKASAINVPGGGEVVGLRIHGFDAAFQSSSDHQNYRQCNLRGNTCAWDFIDNPDGGLGDIRFTECVTGDQQQANFRLSDSAAIANARYSGGHLGIAPITVYRYKGKSPVDRKQAVVGMTFAQPSIEFPGNCIFYDEPGTGTWTRITFDTPAEWGTGGGGKWPGKPTDLATFECGAEASYFKWLNGGPMVSTFGGPLFRAKSIRGIYVDYFDLNKVLDSDWKMFEITEPYKEFGFELDEISLGQAGPKAGGNVATARRAHERIFKGDLLEMVGYGHVRRARNDGQSWAVGFAPMDYEQGDVALACSQFDHWGKADGSGMVVRNTSDKAIPQGALIQPDPGKLGGVKKATTRANAIGRVNDQTIPAATTAGAGLGRAMVSIS